MKIYQLALEVVASVYRLAAEVQGRDRDLANQMRRAVTSVVLNMAEGMYSQGGRKVSRYFDSMGSARETVACLHVCVAARLLNRVVDVHLVVGEPEANRLADVVEALCRLIDADPDDLYAQQRTHDELKAKLRTARTPSELIGLVHEGRPEGDGPKDGPR